MRKILLSAAVCFITSSFSMSAQPVSEPVSGERYDNIYRSAMQYLTFGGSVYVSNIEGKISTMVVDGSDFYLYQPVANFSVSQSYWIKGSLQSDGKVVFPMPQELYTQPANPYSGTPETKIFGKMVKAVPAAGDSYTYEIDEENTDLVMTWKDNVLTQVVPDGYAVPQIFGLCDDHGYTGSGEGALQWSVFTETPVTIPDGLATTQYVCTSQNDWSSDSHVVEIATSGSDMWIKGLYSYFPESCIHGIIDGNKVTFPSNQYLGIYTTENYYYFFQAADIEKRFNEEWGEDEYYNVPAASLTLTKTDGSYYADKAMLMTFGKYTANTGMPSGSCLQNVVFTPYEEAPATPADPEIVSLGEYYDPWGRTVTFNLPQADTEGNYINPDKMYYNVYVNGSKYSLTPEIYAGLEETITDISYNFSMTGVVFTNGSEEHSLTLYIEEEPVIGVQSFYTVGGETRKSAIVYSDGSGVQSIDGKKEAVSTEWRTLTGTRVAAPSAGIFIRIDRHSDGTVTASKVRLR